jgi:L-cysteine desulfidase
MAFFTSLLKKELVVAMGCTEPAAAALAGASARRAFGAMPDRILVRASRDIIKNAMHAGIPNTDMKGINAAVALGVAGGDPANGLNIFSSLDSGAEDKARNLMRFGKIKLELAEGVPPVFIEVCFESGAKRLAARVQDDHSRVTISENPGDEPGPERAAGSVRETGLSLPAIYAYSGQVPLEEISFLVDGARTNLELARHSIETGYGIQVGKTMIDEGENSGKGRSSPDYFFHLGASLAAAASDARMAGCSMPVVINSGSGNQGITVSVPVLVLAGGLGASREETARALSLAHLTALMIAARKGRLSALCGAFTAAIGTAAGFVRLLGGDYGDTERCISNMVGNLIGLLCDGAKGSCALKIYSCVEAAAMGAKIALAGRSPSSEGVLGSNLDETLEAVEKISHEGMVPLDKTVLDLMLKKTEPSVNLIEA